jgi:hypothetical protein
MAGTSKPRATKKSTASKTKPDAKAKATTKAARKSTAKVAKPKEEKKISERTIVARKTRGPRKARAVKGFDELLKKQAELESVTKKAKSELRKEYDKTLQHAESLKDQYKSLFREAIDIVSPKASRATKVAKATRGGGPRVRRTGAVAPITEAEVESFIEQKEQGLSIDNIKIPGRRIKSVKRIDDAYNKADVKDANSIREMLK